MNWDWNELMRIEAEIDKTYPTKEEIEAFVKHHKGAEARQKPSELTAANGVDQQVDCKHDE